MIKKFNIMRVHWKIRFLGGGVGWGGAGGGVGRGVKGVGDGEAVFEVGRCWDTNAHYELEEPSYWHKYPKQITL